MKQRFFDKNASIITLLLRFNLDLTILILSLISDASGENKKSNFLCESCSYAFIKM